MIYNTSSFNFIQFMTKPLQRVWHTQKIHDMNKTIIEEIKGWHRYPNSMRVNEHDEFELYAVNLLMKVGHSQASAAGVFRSWIVPKNVTVRAIEPSATASSSYRPVRLVSQYVPPTDERDDTKTMIRVAMTGKMGRRAKQIAQELLDMKRAAIIASIKAQQEAKKEL